MNLKEMQAEVVRIAREKGWYDEPRSFGEVMALAHSEASEALEAWRSWRLEDATVLRLPEGEPGKPEGVGSEFADVFIRLLDDCDRFGVDLDAEFGIHESFAENINTLHVLIARTTEAYQLGARYGKCLAEVLVFLFHLCEHYGIDLEAEYHRKVAYNRTRPYRHGGRTI